MGFNLGNTVWSPVRESNPSRRRGRANLVFCTGLAQVAPSSKSLVNSRVFEQSYLAYVCSSWLQFVAQNVTKTLPHSHSSVRVAGIPIIMTTMTILEAKKILDIVSVALQESAYEQGHKHRPISALRGYDLQQICTALKLHIANEYLRLLSETILSCNLQRDQNSTTAYLGL